MRKYFLYLLPVIVIITAVFFGMQLRKKQTKPVLNDPKRQIEQYYVPVTNYWSNLSDIKTEELKNKVTIVQKGEKENLKNFLGENVREAEVAEITKGISESQVALVVWNQSTPNLKILSVDGKYLWDKDDVQDYPLKLKVKGEKKDEFNTDMLTKITALGDVMLSRHVNTKIQQLGVNSPWSKTAARIADADITFANLEVPLSDRFPAPSQGMSFIAPTSNIPAIKNAGVDIVSVANNHTANFGWQVFEDNLLNLNKGVIGICGGGLNEAESRSPKIIEKNGTKFAFLCYSSIVGTLYSKTETSGAPALKIEPWYRDDITDIAKMKTDIKSAKEKADVVIVSPHWGVEYKVNPNESQKKVAKAAIEAGADLILGTHPHVVQGAEMINGKYVTYSLGNFIFDQEWSTETKQGTVLESYFYGNKQIAANLVPLEIKDYHQPHFLDQKSGQVILDRIKQASFGF